MALTPGQQHCVETLDKPLVVAAGAGSGKTFTLTRRIVHALESGYVEDIDQICAITFTKKAAGELKSRIRSALKACGLYDQSQKVDDSWISTIHSMCARILRAHAVELGLNPSFGVVEPSDARDLLDRAVDRVLSRVDRQTESKKVDALFAEYGVKSTGWQDTSVESMLQALVAHAASTRNGVESIRISDTDIVPAQALSRLLDEIAGLLALAEGQKPGKRRDEWIARIPDAIERVRRELDAGVDDAMKALELASLLGLPKGFGDTAFKGQVAQAREISGELIMELRLAAAYPHFETLMMLVRRCLDEYASLKAELGVLDNNDLLVSAACALEEEPDIARWYRDRFKLVMIDEFQDTDQMQVDMIKRIAGQDARYLCTVGDAQQSIYRFRGADVSVYERHLRTVGASDPDGIIRLSDNFRSHADVLSLVDEVFARPDMFGGSFMSLAHGRDESKVTHPIAQGASRIALLHTSYPSRGFGIDAARKVAAGRLARHFAHMVEQGRRPGEMAVLLGSMVHSDVYAAALRAYGLPCVISGGSVFASAAEVAVISNIVHVIANTDDSEAFFKLLSSPLFSLNAGDFEQLRRWGKGRFWEAVMRFGRIAGQKEGEQAESTASAEDESWLENAQQISPELMCALQVLSSLRRDRAYVGVFEQVERIVVDSGWLSRLEYAGAEGLSQAGNVYKAIRILRRLEQDGPRGPVSLMRAFEAYLGESKEAPGALNVAAGDSVRIMTVHASKGLEFPIVGLAELRDGSSSLSRLRLSSVDGVLYASLDLSRSLDVLGSAIKDASANVLEDDLEQEDLALAVASERGALYRHCAIGAYEARGEYEEAKRLLYVAMTRAREALAISLLATRSKTNNPQGTPPGILAALAAVFGDGEGAIPQGVSLVDFGGNAAAVVEHVALEPDDIDTAVLSGIACDESDEMPSSVFAVPVVRERRPIDALPLKLLHEGIVSYSSIAEAMHGHPIIEDLADRFALSCDAAGTSDAVGGDSSGRNFVPDYLDGDDMLAFLSDDIRDEDRATDLGTAFHRLAQYAVITRGADGSLAYPEPDRIRALARSCHLDAFQTERLKHALDRWFASDLASRLSQIADLRAEVPFFVKAGNGIYLEGEIDLLAIPDGENRAIVVDYKTGGTDGEDADTLIRKHVLQATCYAGAIMQQGIDRVDAIFVRVERDSAEQPGQPQCVRYRFDTPIDLSEILSFS